LKLIFLHTTKSVIIRSIPFIFLRKYEQLFIDQFGTFDYKHANSILVHPLDASKTLMIRKWQFISVKDILRLLSKIRSCYYSTLWLSNSEDFYYIFCLLQSNWVLIENFPLELIGNIDSESDFFKIAYKYIRNVSIDVDDLWNNYFSEAENRNHFILFNSWESFQENTREDVSLPKRLTVRPTTDMSKEVFNVINNHFSFEGLKILDLFAGTGNIVMNLPPEVAHQLHQ
jgi:hypothetical protein